MSEKMSSSKVFMAIIAAILVVTFIVVGVTNATRGEKIKKECLASGKIYVEKTKTCRAKTTSEKFDEKCTTGIEINEKKYTCADLSKAGLELAYIEGKTIIEHGGSLYEEGTNAEISAGKRVGDYCLSASEAWSYIGETRCVVFKPEYFAQSGYNFFIDEKKDYKTGFVIYMYGNYNWDNFIATYNTGEEVLVCGQIVTYQGHPEIKAGPSNILVSPKKTMRGKEIVYRYSCE